MSLFLNTQQKQCRSFPPESVTKFAKSKKKNNYNKILITVFLSWVLLKTMANNYAATPNIFKISLTIISLFLTVSIQLYLYLQESLRCIYIKALKETRKRKQQSYLLQAFYHAMNLTTFHLKKSIKKLQMVKLPIIVCTYILNRAG